MQNPDIRIEILQDCEIVITYNPKTKELAKKIYYAQSRSWVQYPRLIVGKRTYTIAEAERYFGAEEASTPLTLSRTAKKRA